MLAIRRQRTARPAIVAGDHQAAAAAGPVEERPEHRRDTANGAIVSSRYSSTFGRAAPIVASKKSESASETVTKTSPATPTACASASRANGVNVVDSRRGRVVRVVARPTRLPDRRHAA